MRDRTRDVLSPTLLAAYVDGEVTPSEAAAVGRALEASPATRGRLRDLQHIRDVLATSPSGIEGIDLVGRVRAAAERDARAAAPRRPTRWPRLGLGLGAVATCAVLVAVLARRAPSADVAGEFAVKAAAGGVRSEAERWAGIRVYHEPAQPGGAPQRVGHALRAGAGLLFSYNNLGPRPFAYLMIFGRDFAGDVWWFFPAYERADTNPRSIAIDGPGADVALGELVRQPLHPGPMSIFALFTRTPLGVQEVEAWLRPRGRGPAATAPGTPPPLSPLPPSWGDAYVQQISTAVAP